VADAMKHDRADQAAPRRPPYALVLIGLTLLLLLSLLLAAATGTVAIPFLDTLTTLLSQWGLPVSSTASPTHEGILRNIRFPRIALAATAGASLALAGTLLSGAFRNPLAEPVTTGTAAGALLGTSLAIFLLPLLLPMGLLLSPAGVPTLSENLLRAFIASLFALAATLLVWLTARTAATIHTGPLLLSGLAINALIGATAALILFLVPTGTVAAAIAIVDWVFGGLLTQAVPGSMRAVLIALIIALVITIPLHRPLDILLAGEEEAATSGVHTTRTRLLALIAAAIATGAAVALTGIIAFIGLLAPALLRGVTGPGHLRLGAAAMLLGATLLVIADAIGRTLAPPTEIPAGVLTALAGAPVLLLLLVRSLKEATQ
jgi:iron complex transport system permease protein